MEIDIFTGESIANTLTGWGYPCQFVDYTIAPQVVRYNFNLLNILQLPKIKRLCETLSALAKTKVDYDTSTTSHFALLFTRKERGLIELDNFASALSTAKPYTLAIGRSTNGTNILADLDNLTHILVAGTTNAGKSVLLNDLIISLCWYNKPKDLKMILIDAKKVEFSKYNYLPHLFTNVITEIPQVKRALNGLLKEMEHRYKILAKHHKEKNTGEFPKIVCVIDELSDIVLQDAEIKPLLVRLLQKARASGIHFIVATQSPRAKILDGVMLANLPTRIALTCANVRESTLILGHKGAEKLNFMGDAIINSPTIPEQRFQAPYISTNRIKEILS